jgi:5-methylcytosine-specific restriction endonuclease McrA
MGGEISADNFVRFDNDLVRITVKNGKTEYSKENSRNVSLRLRLKVLNRYNFKCVFCGKNPATNFGTKLHIDHIVPFSKGGKSTLENLQTLCEECNPGKSDSELEMKK